jgi:NAD(P)-dependent dehydrogenase (short-subunit alcohol dehydrogenase family)
MAHGLGSVSGRVAVVTGAASGIGRATARELAKRGAALALCDLDEVGLERTSHELRGVTTRVFVQRVDVTDEAEVADFAANVERELGVADLIVNSAGIVVVGPFLETPLADWDRLMDVNLKGSVRVCRAFLPALLARGRGGYVVNIASAAAYTTIAELSAYGASKHALVGLCQALTEEFFQHRIGVSLICPGFVDTPIASHAELRGTRDETAERQRIAGFLRARGLSAARVAERIVNAAERGQAIVTVGIEARILRTLSRVAPSALPFLMVGGRRLAGWLGSRR